MTMPYGRHVIHVDQNYFHNLVSHTEHLPSSAFRPFFIWTGLSSFISRFWRHFTQ